MKIVFLNVLDCEVKEGVGKFFRRQSNTDVFCLQEAHEKTKCLCRNILSGYEMVADYKYINEDEYFSQVTYVKQDFEVLGISTLL